MTTKLNNCKIKNCTPATNITNIFQLPFFWKLTLTVKLSLFLILKLEAPQSKWFSNEGAETVINFPWSILNI